MKLIVLFLVYGLCSTVAYAQQADFYFGGGFTMGAQTLKGRGAAPASFSGGGWVAEGGLEMSRFHFGLEYGATDIQNRSKDQAFVEAGNLNYFSGKAAVHFGKIVVGAGYRHNQVNLKSLSTTAGYLETNYQGWSPLGFAALNFEAGRRWRTSLEAQYTAGSLASDKNSLPQVNFGEIAVGLRIFILID